MESTFTARTVERLKHFKAQAGAFERHRGFDRSLRRILAAPPGELPWQAVAELYAQWGDPPNQADEIWLRSCLAEAQRCEGLMVQCGASALTLVLGAVCSSPGDSAPSASGVAPRQLWCLEQDAHWANVVRSWLTQYHIRAAHVVVSGARLFDGYVWYGVDPERLGAGVSLLLCDGARATPRGVIGSLDRLGPRLAGDATVLARGVTRAADIDTLKRWSEQHGATCVMVDRHAGFVKISRRNPAS